MRELISIEQLQPGMVILRVSQQNGPVTIQKSGLVSSPEMVQGLIEMGVQEVEIDPSQTVQIAPSAPVISDASPQTAAPPSRTAQPSRKGTPTQALMRGQFDSTVESSNSAISEQFSRSLLLPSAQNLPSIWKYYAKPTSIVALLLVGGFALGFSGVQVPALLASVSSNQVTQVNKQPSEQTSSVLSPTSPTLSNVGQVEAQNDELNREVVANSNVKEVVHPDTVLNSNQAADSIKPYGSSNQIGSNNEVSASVDGQQEDLTKPALEQAVNEGGEVLNEPRTTEPVNISPDLLAKFNQAVRELDSQARQTETQEPETTVTVHNDLQMIHQLPVRVLTRLPSMSFTAHMYASNARDRWVRVNGQQLYEGDWIGDQVQIVNIEAQRVVLNFENEIFGMAALTDW